jgi:His/Glu/Gln/Arg/opine family amino acid ABC transporter permease subunit
MPFDASYIPGYFVKLLDYLPQTLWVVAASLAFGAALGVLLTYVRYYRLPVLGLAGNILVSFIKGTPPLIHLLVVYYSANKLLMGLGVPGSENVCAVLALGFNSGGFMSEALLAALSSVPAGQLEAGYSVGMTRARLMRRIVLPIALPVAIPNIFNICFIIFKASPLVYAIGVVGIMTGARLISSSNFRTIEAYIAAALIYIPVCALAELGGYLLQNRLRRHARATTGM